MVRRTHLGMFETKEEAYEVYSKKQKNFMESILMKIYNMLVQLNR